MSEDDRSTGWTRARVLLRAHGAGAGMEILVNFVLPFALYQLTYRSLGDFNALLCASAPPILWSLLEFLRHRRVDVLSLFVLTGITLSILAFVGGGSVRLLQLRENAATALIGLIFLGSAAIGKPLVYQLARAKYLRSASADAAELDELNSDAGSRRTMLVITIVCGAGLVLSSLLASLLIFVVSISTYLLVGPVIGYGTMGALGLWAYWYGGRQERSGDHVTSASADAPGQEAKPPGGPPR